MTIKGNRRRRKRKQKEIIETRRIRQDKLMSSEMKKVECIG